MSAADVAALRWSSRALVGIVWISAALFGAYILAFYAGAAFDGTLDRWNDGLPGLHAAAAPGATLGIGLHFAAGGVLLLLGPLQLLRPVRDRFRALHRWCGRLYASAAFAAGAGGLSFILVRGTIGGAVMDVGFALYGALMLLASVQTVRFAMRGRMDAHRAWALRLFALAIGSWLYRMEYGFWFLTAGRLGHTHDFTGGFDRAMAFLFYIPNLLLVEAWLRARDRGATPSVRYAVALGLTAASAFVVLATVFFTLTYWGPPILARLPALPL